MIHLTPYRLFFSTTKATGTRFKKKKKNPTVAEMVGPSLPFCTYLNSKVVCSVVSLNPFRSLQLFSSNRYPSLALYWIQIPDHLTFFLLCNLSSKRYPSLALYWIQILTLQLPGCEGEGQGFQDPTYQEWIVLGEVKLWNGLVALPYKSLKEDPLVLILMEYCGRLSFSGIGGVAAESLGPNSLDLAGVCVFLVPAKTSRELEVFRWGTLRWLS